MPFDRLIAAMDSWAALHPDRRVLAQIGDSRLEFQHVHARGWMTAAEFEHSLRTADLVVSHAGIGTILTARRYGIPLLVMPRQARLGEHRDDHQQATARRLEDLGIVPVAWSESDIADRVDAMLRGDFQWGRIVSTRQHLLAAVREIVIGAVSRQ
jgi:UDP-N-acetylglucosamine transferase subunit ALG13